MPYDSTVKNCYSFDKSRNLFCVREYCGLAVTFDKGWNDNVEIIPNMQALGEGPRQRRRMDYRNGIQLYVIKTRFSIPEENPLLCRSRLCEADPSPALWAAPFSKGALAYRYSQQVMIPVSMQALGEGQ